MYVFFRVAVNHFPYHDIQIAACVLACFGKLVLSTSSMPPLSSGISTVFNCVVAKL